MRATLSLLKGLLRSQVRNRQALFWTLFFPVVIMFVFSFIGNTPSRIDLAIVGGGPKTHLVSQAFERATSLFRVTHMGEGAALSAVRSGQEDAALILPASLTGPSTGVRLAYNNSNLVTAQSAVVTIQAFMAQIDVAASGRPPAFVLHAAPLSRSRGSSYLDFLLPGLLALMIMQNSLFSIGSGLTRWKEKGIFRRFMATPVQPVQFLGAAVINYLIFGLIVSAIIVAFGIGILGAHIALPVVPLFVVVLLGMSAFLALGFIIAGVSRTQDATVPIVNLISFPMMFLSGVFFPLSTLPRLLRDIVSFFPLTYVAGAVRSLMSGQAASLSGAVLTDVYGMLAWLIACGAVAAFTWRWE